MKLLGYRAVALTLLAPHLFLPGDSLAKSGGGSRSAGSHSHSSSKSSGSHSTHSGSHPSGSKSGSHSSGSSGSASHTGSKTPGFHSGSHASGSKGDSYGSSGSGPRSTTGHPSGRYGSTSHAFDKSPAHSSTKAAPGVQRDKEGHIARSSKAKDDFRKRSPCPSTGKSSGACPDYVIDHRVPLKRGGVDSPSNMQWQTKQQAKEKDKWE